MVEGMAVAQSQIGRKFRIPIRVWRMRMRMRMKMGYQIGVWREIVAVGIGSDDSFSDPNLKLSHRNESLPFFFFFILFLL